MAHFRDSLKAHAFFLALVLGFAGLSSSLILLPAIIGLPQSTGCSSAWQPQTPAPWYNGANATVLDQTRR